MSSLMFELAFMDTLTWELSMQSPGVGKKGMRGSLSQSPRSGSRLKGGNSPRGLPR